MTKKFIHRYVSTISCVLKDKTEIGFCVIETTISKGRRIVKEKVFNNMDFDPDFGCWVPASSKKQIR